MNMIRTSFKKNYKYIFFFISMLAVGILSGFIYFNLVKDNVVIDLEKELLQMNFSINNMLYHIITLSVLCFAVFLIFGVVFGLFLYFYEAMSIGFILGALFSYFGVSGFLYGLVYSLVFKSIFIILFSVILIKVINVAKNIIGYFLLKKDSTIKNIAVSNFITVIKYSLFIVVSDVFLMFLGNRIISIFSFLIET